MSDNVAVTEGSGKTIATDDVGGVQYQQVKLDIGADGVSSPFTGTLTDITNSIKVHILSTNGTMAVNVGKTDGTVTVRFDPGYELGSVKGINSSVGVYFDQGEPVVRAYGLDGVTSRALKMNSDGAIKVYEVANGTVTVNGTITGITNSINVHILSTNGTMAVNLGKTDGTITIRTDPGYELGSIKGINSSIAVHIGSTGGTLQVRLDAGSPGLHTDDTAFTAATDVGVPAMGFFNDSSTDSVDEGDAGIMRMTGNRIQMIHTDSTASLFVASGTASGVSVSGNTIISPSANASFKVYAYSVQTTGQVSLACVFTNGGGSATEFWRPLITASGVTGAQGANLASIPSAPLFVTGVSTTLALRLDSATLVHYSVAYTKESA